MSRSRGTRRKKRPGRRTTPKGSRKQPEQISPPPPDQSANSKPLQGPGRWASPGTLGLLLVGLVTVTYLSSLFGGFVYDDQVLIVARTPAESLADTLKIFSQPHHPSGLQYYRPLAALTLELQLALWGPKPLPFHLFNVAIVAGLALAIRVLLRLFTESRQPESNGHLGLLVATGGAALFAMHPVTSSTVHAISGRETLLVALLMVLGCSAFLRGGARWLLASWLAFIGALLCKEQAIVLPVLFLLADALGLSADSPRASQLQGSARLRPWLTRHLPGLVIAAGYFALRASIFDQPQSPGTELRLALFDEPTRPLLSVAYSLQSVIVPSFDIQYEPHLTAWWAPWRAALTFAVMVALGVLATRHPKQRAALWFWTGWTLITLLPSANIIAQETLFAERYVVLPWLGVAGLIATLAAALARDPQLRGGLALGLGAWILTLGYTSHHRSQFFEGDLQFLTQWARSDASSYQARASLAEYHRRQRDYEAAVPLEREALRLIHGAVKEPLCIKRHFALADVLTRTGRHAEAAAQYEEILRMKPGYSGARRRLARARRMAGNKPTATSTLDPGRRAQLLELLGADGLAGQSVWFAVTQVDPHSVELGKQLAGLFSEAGWTVRGTQTVSFSIKPGLFMFVADPAAPEYAQQLHGALGKVGLPIKPLATDYRAYAKQSRRERPGWQGFDLAADQDYVLVVGRRAP